MTTNKMQLEKMQHADGFIAALDQSGGSTPKALMLYGLTEDAWDTDEEMFDLVHQMRARIVQSPSFTGTRILGAILFADTMDRTIGGVPSAEYLWRSKQVIPFLKVDSGLDRESDGVQMMKPLHSLDDLLARAGQCGVFGTKMRSVIKLADARGIEAVVEQQFDVGLRILEAGFVPIIEPEVDINSPEKREAEAILKQSLLKHLARVPADRKILLKLTLPEQDNTYADLADSAAVLRVMALSGGYTRDQACERLARQEGMIASFSRALTEGLASQQSDEVFNQTLLHSIETIFSASVHG